MVTLELTNKEWETINDIVIDLYHNNTRDIETVFFNFLNTIQKVIPFEKANVYFFNVSKGIYEIDKFIPLNWEDKVLDKYLDIYYQMDDILPIISCSSPILFKCSDLFVSNEREKTDYYKNFIKTAKIHYGIEGNIIVIKNLKDLYVGGIGMFRSEEDFSLRDLLILKHIRPHLSNIANNYHNISFDLSSILPIINSLQGIGIGFLDKKFKLTSTNNELKSVLKTINEGEFLQTMGKIIHVMNKTRKNCILEKLEIDGKLFMIRISKQQLKEDHLYSLILYSTKDLLLNSINLVRDKFALTEGEYEVLNCFLEGLSNEEIARKIHISLPTVKKRFSGIYQKLGLKGRHQIIEML